MNHRCISQLLFLRENTEMTYSIAVQPTACKSHLVRVQITCLDWYVHLHIQRSYNDLKLTIKIVIANQDLEFRINQAEVKSIYVQ